MIVLGIDPGSHTTGYAFLRLYDPGKIPQVLEYGAIRAKADEDLMQRLGMICAELEKRILAHRPTVLAMEASFYSENARTALVLGHARGAVMGLASRFKMDFFELSPRSIKQYVTGSGAASKDRVATMMQIHLHLQSLPEPQDASDALAVAWTCIHQRVSDSTHIPAPKTPAKSRAKSMAASQPSPLKSTQNLAANAIPAGTDLQALLKNARRKKRP